MAKEKRVKILSMLDIRKIGSLFVALYFCIITLIIPEHCFEIFRADKNQNKTQHKTKKAKNQTSLRLKVNKCHFYCGMPSLKSVANATCWVLSSRCAL